MGEKIILVAFDGAQSLDIAGPAEVFAIAARDPEASTYHVALASRRGGEIVTAASRLSISTMALSGLACQSGDTVLVVGGSERGIQGAASDPLVLAWLQHEGAKARRIGSVCSGAFVLAAAGLLDGRRVATHWSAVTRLAAFRPALSVDANAIFVRDGRVWTSAGITAGIDMALAMVEEDCGRAVADRVAAQLVLHARRPGFQSQFSDLLTAQARQGDPLRGVLLWAGAHLQSLHVEALAQRAGVSVRTLHRLCVSALGTTPAKLIERLRADRARVLLATTDFALKEIADQCGFRDGAQLTRSFSRCFGISPRGYRLLCGERASSSVPNGTQRERALAIAGE